MSDLAVVVPTRSRPEAVLRVADAWHETHAFEDGAQLVFVYDADDPRADEYAEAIANAQRDLRLPYPSLILRMVEDEWLPMVYKLNRVATLLAATHAAPYLGFAGDDHLPRTSGWVARHLAHFATRPLSIVYCDDGYQHERIPTQWTMSADIVRELACMVPAPVEHLYCDNAVRDLGEAAGCLAYLDDVLIEHMHPVAGKAERDEQYDRVNGKPQFARDREAYRLWRSRTLHRQAAQIVRLRREARQLPRGFVV